MLSQFSKILFSAGLCVLLFAPAEAQTKRKKTAAKKVSAVAATPVKAEAKAEVPPVEVSVKRNERPTAVTGSPTAAVDMKQGEPTFRYEFTQPDFVTRRIIIEHDDNGVGKIAFARRGNEELFTDPLSISAAVMKRLNENFTALNFLESTENYQHARDFSHLGNIRITMNRGGRSRLAAFNYTENKNAKAVADTYRAIANQALWVFDITIARANQPLESPDQMKNLEALIKRNEIADPVQMLPFLRELSDDERLPLIARNHATRIIQTIEKSKK